MALPSKVPAMSTHIIRFGNGQYWSGKAGAAMLCKLPHDALRDTEDAHYEKVARMDHPGGNHWTTAVVVDAEEECQAHENSYWERHTMAGEEY